MSNNIKLLMMALTVSCFVAPFHGSAINCPQGVSPCEHDKQCGPCHVISVDITPLTYTCVDWWAEDGTVTHSWSKTWRQNIDWSCGHRESSTSGDSGSGDGSCS